MATLARAVANLARRHELLVGVEFMPYSCTRTVSDALRLAADSEGDDVGLVPDVLHLFCSVGTAAHLGNPSCERCT